MGKKPGQWTPPDDDLIVGQEEKTAQMTVWSPPEDDVVVKKKDETTVSPEPEDGSTQREWVAGGSGSQGQSKPLEGPTPKEKYESRVKGLTEMYQQKFIKELQPFISQEQKRYEDALSAKQKELQLKVDQQGINVDNANAELEAFGKTLANDVNSKIAQEQKRYADEFDKANAADLEKWSKIYGEEYAKEEKAFQASEFQKNKETNPITTLGKTLYTTARYQLPADIIGGTLAYEKLPYELDKKVFAPIYDKIFGKSKELTFPVDERRRNMLKIAYQLRSEGQEMGKDLVNSLDKAEDFVDYMNWAGSAIGQAAGQIPAALLTRGGTAYGQEIGTIYLDGVQKIAADNNMTPEQVMEKGMDDALYPVLLGYAAGKLEMIGAEGVADSFNKKEIIGSLRDRTLGFFKTAGKTGGKESLTEGAQSILEQLGVSKATNQSWADAFMNIDPKDIMESVAQGFVGGTGLSMGGQGLQSIAKKFTVKAKDDITRKTPDQVIQERKAAIKSSSSEQAIEVAADAIEKSVENQPTEEVKNDSQNITRPSGEERVGKEPVQAQPEQGGSNQETSPDRVLQSPQEEVDKEQEYNVFHGTSEEKGFDQERGDLLWFTDKEQVADQYRRRSVFKNEVNLDNFDFQEGDENLEESESAISEIASQQGIDLTKGKIHKGKLKLSKPLDLRHFDVNINSKKQLSKVWNWLHENGLLSESFDSIDEEVQNDIENDYKGQAVWKLLEGEGIYDKAKKKGFDSVIINDVDTKGNPHVSFGLFGPKKFQSEFTPPAEDQEINQKFYHGSPDKTVTPNTVKQSYLAGDYGVGIYFTSDKEEAKTHGENVITSPSIEGKQLVIGSQDYFDKIYPLLPGSNQGAPKMQAISKIAGELGYTSIKADRGNGKSWLIILPQSGQEQATQEAPQPKVQLPADINLSNRKQASDSFRKIKEELENEEGTDDIQTLLVNWNDSELVDDGNGNLKIKNYVGRDRQFSRDQDSGAVNESKADFIKWLFSDEPLDKKKYSVDKEWTDLVNRARAAIGQKEGTQRVFVYGTLQDAATRKKALGEDVTSKRTTIPGFTKQEGEYSTIEKGKGEVRGQMLELTPEQVAKLDKYEEKYDRQEIRPGVFAYVRKPDVNEKGQDKNRPSDEVLNIVRQYEEEAKSPKLDPKDMAIAAVIGKVNRGKYGDANTITSGMAKTYLRKDGTPIDVVAQNASKEGQDITPDDVWDFMQRYPGGPQTMSTPAGNPKLRQLSDRYSELTGKAINRRRASEMAQKYSETVGKEKANTESSKFFDPKTDEFNVNGLIEEMESDPEGYMAKWGIDQETFDHQLNAAYNEKDKQGPPDQADREDGGTPRPGQETLRKGGPLSVRFGDTSQDATQLVQEIISKPLTHVPGLNMGKGLSAGTYISTEEKNRYEGTPQKATVKISNPFVFKDENGIIPFRNQVLEDNRDQFTDEDFESGEKSSWILTLEDLSNKGIDKLAELVREKLLAEGYDSIYLPATETQEGELIVFDQNNVTLQQQEQKIDTKQEEKKQDEIFKAKKPTVTLKFIDDSKVLSKSITEKVVDEDGNTDTREITLAKKQAEIKKEMSKLKQLMDCIYG